MFPVTRLRSPILAALPLLLGLSLACRGEDAKLKIPLPHRSKPTPVQKYNQDGVKAIRKHDYKHAKQLFYKAYLLDPDDPFTLNNLGYVAELEGEVDRAQSFYELAQQNSSEAVVDKSSDKEIEGKTLASVAGHAESGAMKINLINVQAMSLLQKDRAPEADMLLERALQVDAKNPFTLNNLGYAKEKEGELEQAVKFYTAAAGTHAKDPVVVAAKSDWRGKPISDIASANAKKAQKALEDDSSPEARLARLNLRGVSALNRNERKVARDYFQQAYKMNPRDAFTLNNMGYVAELDGDKETADFYYGQAQKAESHDSKVGVATKRDAEGHPVVEVAESNSGMVDQRLEVQQQLKRRQGGSPELIMRRPGAGEDRPPADEDKTDNDTVLQPDQTQQPNAAQPNGSQQQPAPQLKQRNKPKGN